MLLPNPTLLLAGALAVALATGGAYVKGRNDGVDIADAEDARLERVAIEARTAAQRGAAAAIAQIEIRHTTIRQQLEREIHEKLVYGECRHTDYALRRINSALIGDDVSTEQ